MDRSLPQICTYCIKTGTVHGPVMSLIQASFWSVSATVHELLMCRGTACTKSGALSAMEQPSRQASCHNNKDFPLPSSILTEAWKNALVVAYSVKGSSDQERELSVHWSHNQRSRSALPNIA
jgi:hypothetical protein